METITGNDLYEMFNYGTYYIKMERQKLNDINVFPVPDGDTGDNLLQTLQTIVLESTKNDSFYKTLYSISNSALLGARGNSGVIFAQFVNGLQKSDIKKDEISIEEFSHIVEESYYHTISSLSNPKEGTMITIIREWANHLKTTFPIVKSIRELFGKSYEYISKILEKTPSMMDVLSEHNVVDSGALGFVLFVKGIVSYYNDEELEVIKYEEIKIHDHHFEGDVTYRYCTESLVNYVEFNHSRIKKELNGLGDSLIIAQGSERFRIHIHTNEPDKVFDKLKAFGQIETQKIDDMKLEIQLKNSSSKRVLVVDSIADIDKKILDKNNVVVIPINITIDNIPYLDKLSINNKIIFNNLKNFKNYPKTATPSIKYINDLFSRLLLRFEEIIVLSVSKHLSSTYEVIHNEVLKLQEANNKIYVVDTYNNSATEGLLTLRAIEMMNENMSSEEIVKQLELLRNHTQILVCLDTFKYATMSGRLPKIIGKIGMFFKMRPIMSLDNGKGAAYGISLSQKGITKKIINLVENDLAKFGIETYSIVHCMNEKLAYEYADMFTKIIGQPPAYITEISSATAIHSGVGSVAIGYIKSRKEEKV